MKKSQYQMIAAKAGHDVYAVLNFKISFLIAAFAIFYFIPSHFFINTFGISLSLLIKAILFIYLIKRCFSHLMIYRGDPQKLLLINIESYLPQVSEYSPNDIKQFAIEGSHKGYRGLIQLSNGASLIPVEQYMGKTDLNSLRRGYGLFAKALKKPLTSVKMVKKTASPSRAPSRASQKNRMKELNKQPTRTMSKQTQIARNQAIAFLRRPDLPAVTRYKRRGSPALALLIAIGLLVLVVLSQ